MMLLPAETDAAGDDTDDVDTDALLWFPLTWHKVHLFGTYLLKPNQKKMFFPIPFSLTKLH